MKKFYLLLLALLGVVGVRADVVTTMSQLSNTKSYTIKAQSRGYLYYDPNMTDKMVSSSRTTITNDDPNETVVENQIAILRGDNTPSGMYYLYSVAARKFLSYTGSGVTLSLSDTPYVWEVTEASDNSVAYLAFKIAGTANTYINITNWNATEGCKVFGTGLDEGNRMVVTEANLNYVSDDAVAAINTYEAANPDYPVTLDATKIIRVGAQANFLEVANSADDNDHWYIMQQGRYGISPMYDNGTSTIRRAAANFTPNEKLVSGNEKYLVRFFSHGNGYVMQFATGRYVTNSLTTTTNPSQKGWYLLYNIASTDGHIGWNKTSDGTAYENRVDNDGAGNTVSFWESGQVTSTGGNNDWSLYRVSFIDKTPGELTQLINSYSGYSENAGQPGYTTSAWASEFNTLIANAETAASGSDAAAINSAYVNLVDKVDNIQFVLPEPGLYTLKNNAGTGYLVSGTSGTTQVKATDACSVKERIFYFTGTQLVSYDNGMYLKSTSGKLEYYGDETVPTAAISFAVIPQTLGKLNVRFNNGGRYLYSAAIGNTDAGGGNENNKEGYRWTVERVGWLPVPMSAEVGYATLYSPVQLGFGDAGDTRVEAYTATVKADGSAVELAKREDCIPANTGVILKYVTGGTIENGCVFLPVQELTVTGVTSALSGTLADTKIKGDGYVLGKPAGSPIGLYLATKNKQTDAENDSWINNGFKAYLPAPTPNPEARFLAFDFGTETAIEAVEAAVGNDAVIYDLSGRRVQKTQKGLYIVNGKVVIK